MKKINKDPWEINQRESFEAPFLFDGNTNIYLSELDQLSHCDDIFIWGSILALMHLDGKIITDLHTSNIMLSSSTGNWTIVDAGPILDVELHPSNMAQQFIEMYPSWGDAIIPVIGGYARAAYRIIDPVYPNFTDSLIELLFAGSIISTPKPRSLRFDLKRLLLSHKVKIDFYKMEVEKLTLPSKNDWSDVEVLVTFLVLTLSGIKINNLFTNICAFSESNISKAFRAILPNHPKENFESTRMIYALFDFILEISGEPQPWPKNEKVISVLRLKIEKLEADEQKIFFDSIYDGLCYIATQLDEAKKFTESIQLAQSALFFLQFQDKVEEELEGRLCRMDANDANFSWNNFKLNDDAFDIEYFFTYGAYCMSMTTTELLYFQKSEDLVKNKKKTNHLWYSLMQSINRQRKFICICSDIISNHTITVSHFENFVIFLKMVTQLYLQSLSKHFNTILNSITSNADPNFRPSSWFSSWANDGKDGPEFIMRQEVRVAQILYESIENRGLDDMSKRALADMASLIKKAQL